MKIGAGSLIFFFLLAFASCQLLLSQTALAQTPAERCEAATADLPGQIAKAKELLKEKKPKTPPVVDFPDECWGKDPDRDAARQKILATFSEDFGKPEQPLATQLLHDVHELDTLRCGDPSVIEEGMNLAYDLVNRMHDKIMNFMSDNSKGSSPPKAAYLATGLLSLDKEYSLVSGRIKDDIISMLANMITRYKEDVLRQIGKEHNFAMIPTFMVLSTQAASLGGAPSVYGLSGGKMLRGEDADYAYLADATRCKVEVEYNLHSQSGTGKFIYDLSGSQKIKFLWPYMAWVNADYIYDGSLAGSRSVVSSSGSQTITETAAPESTIELKYLQAECDGKNGVDRMKDCERVENTKDAVGNVTSRSTTIPCSVETKYGLNIDLCDRSKPAFSLAITDLGAQKETWVAKGKSEKTYVAPVSLAGFANIFMGEFIDDQAKVFKFETPDFNNKTKDLVDKKFESGVMPAARGTSEVHIKFTHIPR